MQKSRHLAIMELSLDNYLGYGIASRLSIKLAVYIKLLYSLSGLIEKPRQLTFDELGANKNNAKRRALSTAMDNLNGKYGRTVKV